jgi:hypothetical protein
MSQSKSLGRTLGRVLAILLAIGFAVLMPLALMAHSVVAVVFSPDVMASVLTQQFSLAEDIRRPVFEALLGSEGEPDQGLDLSQALGYLTPEEQQQVLDNLIPPGWAHGQIEAAVHQTYAWLDSEDPHPTITLDMRPVKVHWMDSAVQGTVARVIDSWPDCTADKLAEFAASLLSGEAAMVYCAPPGALGELLAGFLTTGLSTGVQALPPDLVLSPGSQRPAEMLEIKESLLTLRALGRWGWLIPVGLLLLILALMVRSVPDWGRWWGWPLLAAGLLSLGGLLGGGWLWRSGLQQFSLQAGGPLVLELLDGVLAALTGQISARLLRGASVLLVSGAALLVMARSVERKRAGGPGAGKGLDTEPPPTGMVG